MNTLDIVLSLVPLVILPYAFILSRRFGMQRVGWMLFAVFSLLGIQQLVRYWLPIRFGLNPELALDLLDVIVPVLLLIGMVHMETYLRERSGLDEQERALRSALEVQVRERTAEFEKANEELQHEIALRRQGEGELRKSKEQYRFLFDENPQPMWIFDRRTFQFLAFNAAAVRHYGYSSEEFRQMTAKDLCLPADVEEFISDANKTSFAVQPRGIWKHVKKDGSTAEAEITALDLIYAGCPARLVLANDVTAQHLLQKKMLEAQKAEITHQLAGGIATNFTRLTSAIQTDAATVSEKCTDPECVEPLKRIKANAACADSLTDQLLALVRRYPMQPRALNLNEWIETQNGSLTRLLGDKIALQKACWADLPSVMADPAVIEQIIRNLLTNARDAMPNGGSVTITTAPVKIDEAQARRSEDARPGAFVCLSVTDTGSGMAPEVQARLFEPFFTTKTDAAGLGLATVRGLVRQHSGWLEVQSQPGEGSRFRIFLPYDPSTSPGNS